MRNEQQSGMVRVVVVAGQVVLWLAGSAFMAILFAMAYYTPKGF